MKGLTSVGLWSGLALVIGAGFVSADAQAATSSRFFYSNPAGLCQGALPAFETQIRKRPLAVQNEGSSNSFVTCAFTSQGSYGATTTNPTTIVVWFNAIGGADVTINCTGVSGYQTGNNEYIPKSAVAPASGGQVGMTWSAADFEGAPANFPAGAFAISCNLPPGGAINDSRMTFAEEIGT